VVSLPNLPPTPIPPRRSLWLAPLRLPPAGGGCCREAGSSISLSAGLTLTVGVHRVRVALASLRILNSGCEHRSLRRIPYYRAPWTAARRRRDDLEKGPVAPWPIPIHQFKIRRAFSRRKSRQQIPYQLGHLHAAHGRLTRGPDARPHAGGAWCRRACIARRNVLRLHRQYDRSTTGYRGLKFCPAGVYRCSCSSRPPTDRADPLHVSRCEPHHRHRVRSLCWCSSLVIVADCLEETAYASSVLFVPRGIPIYIMPLMQWSPSPVPVLFARSRTACDCSPTFWRGTSRSSWWRAS